MRQMTTPALFLETVFSKLSLATSGVGVTKTTKTDHFGSEVSPDLAPQHSRFHFLVLCVSDSELLKCDILCCGARSALGDNFTKNGQKRTKSAKEVLYYVTIFQFRFLVVSIKLTQITQFRK